MIIISITIDDHVEWMMCIRFGKETRDCRDYRGCCACVWCCACVHVRGCMTIAKMSNINQIFQHHTDLRLTGPLELLVSTIQHVRYIHWLTFFLYFIVHLFSVSWWARSLGEWSIYTVDTSWQPSVVSNLLHQMRSRCWLITSVESLRIKQTKSTWSTWLKMSSHLTNESCHFADFTLNVAPWTWSLDVLVIITNKLTVTSSLLVEFPLLTSNIGHKGLLYWLRQARLSVVSWPLYEQSGILHVDIFLPRLKIVSRHGVFLFLCRRQ